MKLSNSISPQTNASVKKKGGFSSWLNRQLVLEKFKNPFGLGMVILTGLFFGIIVGKADFEVSVIIFGVIIGLPILAAILIDMRFGVVFIIVFSFFLITFKRIVDVPFGIFLDSSILLMFIALLFRKSGANNDWSFAKNPISLLILLWISYNLLQIINPVAASREAWMYTVRGMAGTIVLYYIILYTLDSYEFIIKLLKLIFGLCLLAGIYSIWQEYVGLAPWEERWLYGDIERYKLIFQAGRIRKFSFLSDPTTFGIMMAYMFVVSYTLLFGPYKTKYKVILGISCIIFMMGAFWSGTRTAYLVIPAGLIFVMLAAIMKGNMRLVGVTSIFFVLGAVATQAPTSNNTLYRVQTAFKPTKDMSYQVRMETQSRIKSIVQRHPFGGGLGSCGAWGKRFSGHTVFADIEPDSGYVRVAVELGWLGLILYNILLFVGMWTGIKHLVRSRDPVIVNIYMALSGLLFSLLIANYGQEAIILVPNSIVFYSILAIMVRLKDFDPNYVITGVQTKKQV
jgi:putative inorganic carbon (HCO3(-)) transporter